MLLYNVKVKLKNLLPLRILNMYRNYKSLIRDKYSFKSYSQEGEDMILKRIFNKKSNGFYVDIGAHHPKRFSNTQYFYKKGWRGINIDPLPGSKMQFEKYRKKDINIELLISNKKTLKYYLFSDSAYNTTNENLAESVTSKGVKLLDVKDLKCKKLKTVLDECNLKNKLIDFMSIDVEGQELDVLKSNDWEKYRPTIICIEILNFNLYNFDKSSLHRLLANNGYELFAKTVNSWFYRNVKIKLEALDK